MEPPSGCCVVQQDRQYKQVCLRLDCTTVRSSRFSAFYKEHTCIQRTALLISPNAHISMILL